MNSPGPPPPMLMLPPLPPPGQRWIGRITVAFAAAAAVLAAAALIVTLTAPPRSHSPQQPPPAPAAAAPTPEQIADAKTKTCTAWEQAERGITLAADRLHGYLGGADEPRGAAYRANLRVAYLFAALWLPQQPPPATPQPLKAAIGKYAAAAGDAGARSISEDDPDSSDSGLNTAATTLRGLCRR